MNLRRLRPAEWLLATAAIALLADLFAPWFQIGRGSLLVVFGNAVGRRFSAWQAFDVVDVALAACALVGLVAVVLQATQRSPALPIVASVAATWAGLIATVLVVIKLIDPPSLDAGSASFDVLELCWGAWVGLGAALGLAGGGWWAMRDDKPGFAMRPATR
jgi:hypothetical protein